MNKTLTLSVAAYQVEQYINQTLDSLIDERVIDELEIFVIDDGGIDRSLEIAKEYANKYSQSIFPIHKENEGYGSTVNYSIAHAKGKYFKCLDGDDWFNKEEFCKFVIALRESTADVIITPYCRCFAGKPQRPKNFTGKGNGEYIKISDLQDNNQFFTMWTITYKTEMLQRSKLKLPNHTLYTDMLFTIIPFSVVHTIQFFNYYVYFYRLGRTEQSVSKESRRLHLREHMDICEQLCIFTQEEKLNRNDNFQYMVRRTAAYCIASIKTILLNPINGSTLKIYQSFEQMIRKTCPDVDHYIYTTAKGKYACMFRMIRKTNYKAFWMLKFIPFSTALRSIWTKK